MVREPLIIYYFLFHENNCPLALRYMVREAFIILVSLIKRIEHSLNAQSPIYPSVSSQVISLFVCWSLTSLCHSNGHIETMPAREMNPFTGLTRIRSQFLRTQWSTSNHSEWTRLRIRPLSHRGWLVRLSDSMMYIYTNKQDYFLIYSDINATRKLSIIFIKHWTASQ